MDRVTSSAPDPSPAGPAGTTAFPYGRELSLDPLIAAWEAAAAEPGVAGDVARAVCRGLEVGARASRADRRPVGHREAPRAGLGADVAGVPGRHLGPGLHGRHRPLPAPRRSRDAELPAPPARCRRRAPGMGEHERRGQCPRAPPLRLRRHPARPLRHDAGGRLPADRLPRATPSPASSGTSGSSSTRASSRCGCSARCRRSTRRREGRSSGARPSTSSSRSGCRPTRSSSPGSSSCGRPT